MRWGRVIAGTVALAAMTPVIGVVALNVFLNAGLPVLLNLKPSRVKVEFDRAWCWIPGEVEVHGLRIRLDDPAGRWDISVDHVTGDIALEPLRDRRLVVTDVHGTGAVFRFASVAQELPTEPHPWSVELSGVVLDELREIRVDDWSVAGGMRATGGLQTSGESWMAFRDTAVDLFEARAFLGEAPVASGVRGRMTLSAAGDPLAATDFLSSLDAGVGLRADVEDLRFLAYYLGEAPWLKVRGGVGELSAELLLEGGRFRPGSRLRAATKGLAADFLSYAVVGDGDVRFDVGDDGAALVVAFSDYAITLRGDAVPHVEGKGFQVTARAPEVGLVAPPVLDVAIELPPSRIRDVRVFNTYLPSDLGFTLAEGRGTVRGHLEASTSDAVATGTMTLSGERVRATFDDLTITGDFSLKARLREGRLGTGRYDMSGTKLSLRDVDIVEAGRKRVRSAGWWADVMLPDGRVHVGAPIFLDARLDVSLRDSVPIVSVFSQRARVPEWVRGLMNVENLRGTARVRVGDDRLHVPDFAMRGGQYEVLLRLDRRRDDLIGDMFARYGTLSVGVALVDEKSTVQVFGARKWWEGRRK
jgi:hypothetical protein